MGNKYFVTGATGCIGGWVVKNLVESGEEVYALVRNPGKLAALELIMKAEDIAKLHVVEGDITDYKAVEEGIVANEADYVIHLAGMQLPFCKADPALGAKVNVEGTVNIFEAAKKRGLKSLVYASSTAVYGNLEEYEGGVYHNHSPFLPHAHYGVYKVANEGTAKIYYESDGISSIGLRPYVAYGPLRDQGMTSTPTTAMKEVLKGNSYEISYGGDFDFQYADDVAKTFIQAARAEYTGAYCYNFPANSVNMEEVVEAIEEACPQAKGKLTYVHKSLPFPKNASGSELEDIIGKIPVTPLKEGVRRSMEIFREKL